MHCLRPRAGHRHAFSLVKGTVGLRKGVLGLTWSQESWDRVHVSEQLCAPSYLTGILRPVWAGLGDGVGYI